MASTLAGTAQISSGKRALTCRVVFDGAFSGRGRAHSSDIHNTLCALPARQTSLPVKKNIAKRLKARMTSAVVRCNDRLDRLGFKFGCNLIRDCL
uniref:Uncharacterized protein n=1 Tax=Physcomitrium patens TaxID=3218 RepID=A0A2K1L2K7_PHYPA|nr:hypothetical protein PHYPA_003050 [Physcomitrium patens]